MSTTSAAARSGRPRPSRDGTRRAPTCSGTRRGSQEPGRGSASGGIDLGNLDEVRSYGVSRVVVVRAITEAEDPGAAAAEFAKRLAG
ncbi:hypothetical protein GCM10020219_025220 [Nonomuraea dietziae]